MISPAIGSDGTVYVGSLDKMVYAVDGATGEAKWRFESTSIVESSPAFGADGTLFVGSNSGMLYALSAATGTKKWDFHARGQFSTGNDVMSSPALAEDGTVFFASDNGNVYALNGATGAKKWEFATGKAVGGSPVVGANGTLYVISDGRLYALDAGTGRVSWLAPDVQGGTRTPALGADGTVFVGPANGYFRAFDGVSGRDKWPLSDYQSAYALLSMGASPVLSPEGRIYFGGVSASKKLFAHEGVTGAKLWEFETRGAVNSVPAIGADGTVYFGCDDQRVYAVDGMSGVQKWSFLTGGAIGSSAAIGADGTVFVGSRDMVLYALVGHGPPPSEGWPMWRKDSPRTASLHVLGPAQILGSPISQQVPQGGTVSRTVLAGGTPPLTYRWQKNGVDLADSERISGMQGPHLRIGHLGLEDAGSYRVIVGNTLASVTSESCELTLRTPVDGEVRWAFTPITALGVSPALGRDGILYIPSRYGGIVYALDAATGFLKWETILAKTSVPAELGWPVIGPEGSLYIHSSSGLRRSAMVALDGTTGVKKWEIDTGDVAYPVAPAIGLDGIVYVPARPSLYAVDGVTGAQRWAFEYVASYTSPVVLADGNVVIGAASFVAALESGSGRVLWKISCPAVVSLGLGDDNRVYVGLQDKRLLALDGATGATNWQANMLGGVDWQPAIGTDGTVYVGSSDRSARSDQAFYALDPVSGVKRWEFTGRYAVADRHFTSPALVANGRLYVIGRHLYALDSVTGALEWFFPKWCESTTSPIVGPDGTVFVAPSDGALYALFGSSPPAESIWPMLGANVSHTSSVQVGGRPEIASEPQDQEATLGSHVSLTVSARGTLPLLYRWQKNGVDLAEGPRVSGTATSQLRIVNVQAGDAGSYRVVISNLEGTTTSTAAVLRLKAPMLGEVRWRYEAGTRLTGPPALGPDDGLYVGGYRNLFALDAQTGELRWKRVTNSDFGPVAVSSDGTVYVGSSDRKFQALEGSTGTKVWEFAADGGITACPGILGDGTVLVTSDNGRLFALDPLRGLKKWEFTVGGTLRWSAAIGPEGNVYISSPATALYALDGATGETKWTSTAKGEQVSVGGDGSVFLVDSMDRKTYAVDGASGALKWQVSNLVPQSAPTLAVGGTVYEGSYFGRVRALDPHTGQVMWEFFLPGDELRLEQVSPPAVGADGVLYATGTWQPDDLVQQRLYTLDERTGTLRGDPVVLGTSDPFEWRRLPSPTPVIGSDGTVYLALEDNTVCALFGSGAPARSSWPTFGRDARRTHRAGDWAPFIFQHPGAQDVSSGGTLRLGSRTEGTMPMAFQWRFNGQTLAGASQAELVIQPVEVAHGGAYDLVVTNDFGAMTSLVATVTVRLATVAPSIVVEPVDSTAVSGGPAEFSVEASGTEPLAYQWRKDGVAVEGAVTRLFSLAAATPVDAGGYDVIVTNEVGAITSVVARLAVLLPPSIVTQPQDVSAFEGDEVRFSVVAAGAEPLQYAWTHNEAGIAGADGSILTLDRISLEDGGTYQVVVSNAAGSVSSELAMLDIQRLTINILRSQETVLLQWEGAARLHWTDRLPGAWQELPDATSPFRVVLDGDARFYRLIR
ncbi:MAG: PQQ-binding-like beta-propeller repeat protein [Verrucomicrobiales bacterium]|nr:PQQ-binding-like beta-propeller repeat protein [Verrucomicrobiales bacterium]